MTAKDVQYYLSALGVALAAQHVVQPVRVLLLGGAYMLTQVKMRRTTDDIDVFL